MIRLFLDFSYLEVQILTFLLLSLSILIIKRRVSKKLGMVWGRGKVGVSGGVVSFCQHLSRILCFLQLFVKVLCFLQLLVKVVANLRNFQIFSSQSSLLSFRLPENQKTKSICPRSSTGNISLSSLLMMPWPTR